MRLAAPTVAIEPATGDPAGWRQLAEGKTPKQATERLRTQLWAHHLGVHRGAVTDPLASRQLWDTAPNRHVCRYDPKAHTDPWGSDRPDGIIDPSDRRSGDPCETLLGVHRPR